MYLDEKGRMCKEIADGLTVRVRLLNEADPRRVNIGVQAYAVLDLSTPFGALRIPDIRIVERVTDKSRVVRWKQWPVGRHRDGGKPFICRVGPLGQDARQKLEERLLEFFSEILVFVGREKKQEEKQEETNRQEASA